MDDAAALVRVVVERVACVSEARAINRRPCLIERAQLRPTARLAWGSAATGGGFTAIAAGVRRVRFWSS